MGDLKLWTLQKTGTSRNMEILLHYICLFVIMYIITSITYNVAATTLPIDL